MTKNQLEYWKLRWQQHYENILAQVKVAEVAETRRSNLVREKETERHNRAVEAETARHNKREEYIDTQNMIINRGNLEARWAELDEKHRAAVVAEALNEKKYQLEVDKLLEDVKWHGIQAQNMLENRRIAVMSIKSQLMIEKNKNNVEWYKAAAQSLKNGYDKAVLNELLADTKSYFSNKEFDRLLNDLDARFPELQGTRETYGPDTANQILRAAGGSDKASRAAGSGGKSRGKNDVSIAMPSEATYVGGSTGGGSRGKNDIPIAMPSEAKYVEGFSNTINDSSRGTVVTGKTGARSYSNHEHAGSTKHAVETKTSRGTSVVYSPGTHYGPGF